MKDNQDDFLNLIRERVLEREKELAEEEDREAGYKATLDALEQITRVPRSEIDQIAEDIERERYGPNSGDRPDVASYKEISHLPETTKKALSLLPDDLIEDYIQEYRIKRKTILWSYLFWLIPPPFSFYYLYLRKPASQIFFSLSFGGFYLWWILDLLRIPFMVEERNVTIGHKILLKLIEKTHHRQKGNENFYDWFKKRLMNLKEPKP